MARANRHFVPGYIWHLTHRCHRSDFLLKFGRDRSFWVELLFEAKKRYRLSICNFMVTSNHVHLIVSDNGFRNAIPRSIQLIAGRTGQEYNRRKNRKGAFWEDRYHATAVESGDHLWKCMVYVDMNMVRAGVVEHPSQWKWCGYHEIQKAKQRYRIIDHDMLIKLLRADSKEELAETHRRWVESEIKQKPMARQEIWTHSLAVGSRDFVEKVKEKLGSLALGRVTACTGSRHQLREKVSPYPDLKDESDKANQKTSQTDNRIRWKE